jgi:hypothetical protein
VKDQAIHVGTATVRGGTSAAFFVEYSRRRTILFAVLSAGFAVVGGVMLLVGDTEAKLWGGASLLLFGAGTVVLAMSVGRLGRVSLTPAGLLVESRFGGAFAPWDVIVRVERTHIQRQEMITVDVADSSRLETSRHLSWLKGLNESMGMPDLAIPTSLLGDRSHALERAIAHYIGHPEARSRIGTASELALLLGRAPAALGVRHRERPPRPRNAFDTAATAVLWVGGTAGLVFTILGALGGSDPGRETSHLVGVLVFGTTSVAAVLSAWLLPRRARTARVLGLVAAAGALFIGWLLTQSSRSGLGAVMVGIVVAVAGAYVGWRLFRWSRPRAQE